VSRPQGPRTTTAIRFPVATHEALKETADELGVSVNWLVTRLVEGGLERMDLSNWKLVRR
jgi:predicted DNA-binding protein